MRCLECSTEIPHRFAQHLLDEHHISLETYVASHADHGIKQYVLTRCKKQREKYYQSAPCCLTCGKVIPFELKPNRYCNHRCSALATNKLPRRPLAKNQKSKAEVALLDAIRSRFPELAVIQSDRVTCEGLELDISIPSLKLALEWNGIVHYEPIFGSQKLVQYQERDQRKQQILNSKGWELVVAADYKLTVAQRKKLVEDCLAIISRKLSAK